MLESAGRFGVATGWGHDIRTHLNILLSGICMISTGKLSKAQTNQYLNMLCDNVLAILRMVNRLMEADCVCEQHETKMQDHQIDGFLTKLAEDIRLYAASKNIEVLYDIASPLYAHCNMEMLERVLYNLLSNAVKYTDANGFVYISARDKGDSVQINVADTGRGLTEAQLQAVCSDDPNSKGIGIGLRLVKSMTAQMRGRIECTSRERVGTTFYLHVPPAVASNAESALVETVSAEGSVSCLAKSS